MLGSSLSTLGRGLPPAAASSCSHRHWCSDGRLPVVWLTQMGALALMCSARGARRLMQTGHGAPLSARLPAWESPFCPIRPSVLHLDHQQPWAHTQRCLLHGLSHGAPCWSLPVWHCPAAGRDSTHMASQAGPGGASACLGHQARGRGGGGGSGSGSGPRAPHHPRHQQLPWCSGRLSGA